MIGSGARAADHIEAWSTIPDTRVVACSGLGPLRRGQVAARYGLEAFADPGVMIETVRPDVVQIVTGPDSRVELMNLVSELGVAACSVEKPIATGFDDWLALRRLQAQSRTKFAVCHQLRWHHDLQRCRAAMSDPRMGPVELVEMSCGMGISGQGTHALDYGLSLVGDPRVEIVFGVAGHEGSDPMHPGASDVTAALRFDNGVRALLVTGSMAPRCGDPSTTWQHVRVAGWADRGRVAWEEFGETVVSVAESDEQRTTWQGMDAWREGNRRAQVAFHEALVLWLRGGPPPATNLETALHQWAVMLAIGESSRQGRPVRLDELEGTAQGERLRG